MGGRSVRALRVSAVGIQGFGFRASAGLGFSAYGFL